MPASLSSFLNFHNHSLVLLSKDGLNPVGCPHMSSGHEELRGLVFPMKAPLLPFLHSL